MGGKGTATMGNTLVLSATITPPPGVPDLQRTDPQQRIGDYARALDFYCRLPETFIRRIVFIENSATDLTPLREVVSKANASGRVEFVSFDGLDHPPQYGRGYGEFKLLDYAMEHSHTLKSVSDTERLWKVTGRYRVLNLVDLIRSAPQGFALYCDMRDFPIPWVDLRVFGVTLAGYRRLLRGVYSHLREDVNHMPPEQYLRPVIERLKTSHPIVSVFRRELRIDGIRGMDGQNYSSGVNLLKYWVRRTIRRLPILRL
jgi:hypothetical protein